MVFRQGSRCVMPCCTPAMEPPTKWKETGGGIGADRKHTGLRSVFVMPLFASKRSFKSRFRHHLIDRRKWIRTVFQNNELHLTLAQRTCLKLYPPSLIFYHFLRLPFFLHSRAKYSACLQASNQCDVAAAANCFSSATRTLRTAVPSTRLPVNSA